MGTGSTRKRSQTNSRYNAVDVGLNAQGYSGPPGAYNPNAVDPWGSNPAPISYRDWQGVDPTTGTEVAPDQRGGVGTFNRGWGAYQFGDPKAIFMDAWRKSHPAAPPKSNLDLLTEQFNRLYADPTQSIRDAYGGAVGAADAAYGRRTALLGNEAGAATAGVQAEGQRLQGQLTDLGADAGAQMAKYNNAIKQGYVGAGQNLQRQAAQANASLRANGVDPNALAATTATARGELAAGRAADTGLSNRYQQLLHQEINDRQATGATITTGNVDEIARILQQSKAQAGDAHDAAVAKLEANMASDIASAAGQRNTAKFQLFLQSLKQGNSTGTAASTVAGAREIRLAQKDARANALNLLPTLQKWQGSFKPDPNGTYDYGSEVAAGSKVVNGILTAARNNQDPIAAANDALASLGEGGAAKNPHVASLIVDVLAYLNNYQAAQQAGQGVLGGGRKRR